MHGRLHQSFRVLPIVTGLLLFTWAGNTRAQDVDGSVARPERIETDRDSFTPTTRVVGKHHVVVESAYSFEDNRRGLETHSFPELLIRFGISRRIELRLGWNYEVGGTGAETTGADAELEAEVAGTGLLREHSIAYGMKIEFNDQMDWIPESACILQGFTPTGGEATATQLVATYVFGWELPKRSKFDAAIRYGTNSEEGDHFNTWAASAVWKIEMFDRVSLHAEYFGIFSANRREEFNKQFFSPGIHFLLTDNFEIGTRVGWGLNDQSARFFCNAGVGLRF